MERNYIRWFVSGLKLIRLCCTNIYMPHIVVNECGMHLCRALTDLCMRPLTTRWTVKDCGSLYWGYEVTGNQLK